MAAVTATQGIVTVTISGNTFLPVGPHAHVRPQAFLWYGAGTAGATCVVTDVDGNEVLKLTCGSVGETTALGKEFFAGLLPWRGALTFAFGSGAVKLYV